MQKFVNVSQLIDHGISLLSRRPHSKFELNQKLLNLCRKRKNRSKIRISNFERKNQISIGTSKAEEVFLQCSKAVPISIQKLEELNYIDDLKYAAWHVDQRQRWRPRSKREILSELYKKGISKSDSEKALSNYSDIKECQKLVQKKYLRDMHPSKIKTQLIRRGFRLETVEQILIKTNATEAAAAAAAAAAESAPKEENKVQKKLKDSL